MREAATVRVADVLRAALDVLSDEDYARLAARIDVIAEAATTAPTSPATTADTCCYRSTSGDRCRAPNQLGGFCFAHDTEIHEAGGDNSPDGHAIIERSALAEENARRVTMPAREWSGPDRWQAWDTAGGEHPDDGDGVEPPDGFTPIGPWKPYQWRGGGEVSQPYRDWRRPLRRVQG